MCVDKKWIAKAGFHVPCGKCYPCIKRKITDWSTRLHFEEMYSRTKPLFLTLTYSNENLKFPAPRARFATLCKGICKRFLNACEKLAAGDLTIETISDILRSESTELRISVRTTIFWSSTLTTKTVTMHGNSTVKKLEKFIMEIFQAALLHTSSVTLSRKKATEHMYFEITLSLNSISTRMDSARYIQLELPLYTTINESFVETLHTT